MPCLPGWSTPGLGWWRHDGFLIPAGAAIAVGALAFLPWNAGQARVFLGDTGSYALGAALAMLAAYAVVLRIPAEAALGPLALYIADTAWTLLRRIRAGERWLEAHRSHVYQQWCDVGWSHQRVTLAAAAVTSLLSLLGAASLCRRSGPARAPPTWPRPCVLLAYLRCAGRCWPGARVPGLRDEGVTAMAHPPGDPLFPAGDGGAAGSPVRPGVRLGRGRQRGRRAHRHAQPSDRGDPGAVPGRDPAARAPGRLPGGAHLAVRHPQRGGRPRDHRPPELHAHQRAARRARQQPANVVVVSSPTFFSIGAGWLLARLKRARLVVEVRDLWPAIFTELGVLTRRPLDPPARAAGTGRLRGGRYGDRGQRRLPRQPARPQHAGREGAHDPQRRAGPATSIPAPGRTRGCAPGSARAGATPWCSTPGRTASPRASPRWPRPLPSSRGASRSGSRSSARARTSSG